MAQNDTIQLDSDVWTLISEVGEDITEMSAQNLGNHRLFFVNVVLQDIKFAFDIG